MLDQRPVLCYSFRSQVKQNVFTRQLLRFCPMMKKEITYPTQEMQCLLIKFTLKAANVDPNSILYIEAHGKGTQVGDQCEMEAISRAYCEDRPKERPLLVGSVKTNLGHSEPASALTSIAKVLVAFENNSIPASINFERPNPNNIFDFSLVRPVTDNILLIDNSIIGINSFGYGGSTFT